MQLVLLAGIALRIVPLSASPELSGDVYRYLWDGSVSASGVSPYAYAPDDRALESLRTDWHARINHPEIRSIYPPAAQVVFAMVGLTGTGLLGWKGLLLLCDLLTITLILRSWGSRTALAYALFPLVIIEGLWSAHVEVLATLILLAGYGALVGNRASLAGALLATATLVKVIPAVALPAFLRHSSKRNVLLAGFFGTMLVFLLPFVVRGPLMPGLSEYARRWSFNSPAYALVSKGVETTGLANWLKVGWTNVKDPLSLEMFSEVVYSVLYPDAVTRAILGIALIALLSAVLKMSRKPASIIASSIGALLLCSPTIQPWYWLPLLPFAMGSRSVLWIALAAASPFSYLLYEGTSGMLIFALCYGVPLIIAVFIRDRIRSPIEPSSS